MSEWHITPDYIENHWTNELLNLMVKELEKRKEREKRAISDRGDGKVSDADLFRQMGNKIKVTKK